MDAAAEAAAAEAAAAAGQPYGGSMWSRASVQLALLRAPVVVLLFLVLWAINCAVFNAFDMNVLTVLALSPKDEEAGDSACSRNKSERKRKKKNKQDTTVVMMESPHKKRMRKRKSAKELQAEGSTGGGAGGDEDRAGDDDERETAGDAGADEEQVSTPSSVPMEPKLTQTSTAAAAVAAATQAAQAAAAASAKSTPTAPSLNGKAGVLVAGSATSSGVSINGGVGGGAAGGGGGGAADVAAAEALSSPTASSKVLGSAGAEAESASVSGSDALTGMTKMNIETVSGVASAVALGTSPRMIMRLVGAGLALYISIIVLWCFVLGGAVEDAVLVFYGCALVLALTPWLTRCIPALASFWRLLRALMCPMPPVMFSEVLLADALTSLSKVFQDVGLVAIYALCRLTLIRLEWIHGPSVVFISLLASVPFLIRVRQCYVAWKATPRSNRFQRCAHLVNIGKYVSSFPPIWLAAIHLIWPFSPEVQNIARVTSVVNSFYAFCWDITMDWGLIHVSALGVNRRPIFLYRVPGARSIFPYIVAVVFNAMLRFAWALREVPLFAAVPSATLVFTLEVAEVTRRAVWNLFRVEWEVINKVHFLPSQLQQEEEEEAVFAARRQQYQQNENEDVDDDDDDGNEDDEEGPQHQHQSSEHEARLRRQRELGLEMHDLATLRTTVSDTSDGGGSG